VSVTGDFEAYLGEGGTLDDLLAMEDVAGIEKIVLMPSPVMHPDNRGVAAAARGNDRIIPCACVSPALGDEAAQELERALDDGMRGLKLMPPRHGYKIIQAEVDPFMEIARAHKIPVTIHSQNSSAHPLEIAVLAGRFPDIPIIMDHMGHRYWAESAVAAARQCDNIWLGTTIAAFEPAMVQAAVDAIGAKRVVFGSNAPRAYPDLAVESIRRLQLPDADEAAIFCENLATIYEL
jgi:predicted TIM-barrel fold metal-dependent hydrolase